MKVQQKFCQDYRGRSLERPIYVEVKFGCELRRSDVQNRSRLPLPSSVTQSSDGDESNGTALA